MQPLNYTVLTVIILACLQGTTFAFKTRATLFSPKKDLDKPKLVIIGGCTGTGKSTFGMSVALDQDILKCVSTDTVRSVMRSFITDRISPPLHRSSYAPASDHDDPVESWKETCSVLEASIEELVTDSIRRRQGLVLEGVSITPSSKLIEIWEAAGGVAAGCLLTISNADTHKRILRRRGEFAGKDSEQKIKDEEKIASFDRIRQIQDEMIKLAQESKWILMEQKFDPDPLDIIEQQLENNDLKIPESFKKVNGKSKLVSNEHGIKKEDTSTNDILDGH